MTRWAVSPRPVYQQRPLPWRWLWHDVVPVHPWQFDLADVPWQPVQQRVDGTRIDRQLPSLGGFRQPPAAPQEPLAQAFDRDVAQCGPVADHPGQQVHGLGGFLGRQVDARRHRPGQRPAAQHLGQGQFGFVVPVAAGGQMRGQMHRALVRGGVGETAGLPKPQPLEIDRQERVQQHHAGEVHVQSIHYHFVSHFSPLP